MLADTFLQPSTPEPQPLTRHTLAGWGLSAIAPELAGSLGVVWEQGPLVPSHPLGPRSHLHGGAGGPSLVERAPALPAVDRVLHLHAQLPGHRDLVIVLDVLQGPVGGGQIVGTCRRQGCGGGAWTTSPPTRNPRELVPAWSAPPTSVSPTHRRRPEACAARWLVTC